MPQRESAAAHKCLQSIGHAVQGVTAAASCLTKLRSKADEAIISISLTQRRQSGEDFNMSCCSASAAPERRHQAALRGADFHKGRQRHGQDDLPLAVSSIKYHKQSAISHCAMPSRGCRPCYPANGLQGFPSEKFTGAMRSTRPSDTAGPRLFLERIDVCRTRE